MKLFLSFICILTTLLAVPDLVSGNWRYRRQDEGEPADAAAAAKKMCAKCVSAGCKGARSDTMDCSADKMSALGLKDDAKMVWDNATADAAEDFDNPEKYTHCLMLQLKDGDTNKAEIRGCVPEKVTVGEEEKEVCALMTGKVKNLVCKVCPSVEVPCNNETSLYDGEATGAAHRLSLDLSIYFWILSAVLVKILL
ncbi:uncharacterized protein LOC135142973 [Zophobas morio]|uniref:uncharacterized protein LOC135142973 n=1 Tax=Zophobas morio TaxID=2755281 RepID=UPI0030830EB2